MALQSTPCSRQKPGRHLAACRLPRLCQRACVQGRHRCTPPQGSSGCRAPWTLLGCQSPQPVRWKRAHLPLWPGGPVEGFLSLSCWGRGGCGHPVLWSGPHGLTGLHRRLGLAGAGRSYCRRPWPVGQEAGLACGAGECERWGGRGKGGGDGSGPLAASFGRLWKLWGSWPLQDRSQVSRWIGRTAVLVVRSCTAAW